MDRSKQGFTLLELLTVLAIVSLFAVLVVAGVADLRARARDTKRVADFRTLKTALLEYELTFNALPDNEDDDDAGAGGFDVGNSSQKNNDDSVDAQFIPALAAENILPGSVIETSPALLLSYRYFKYPADVADPCGPSSYAILAIKLEKDQSRYNARDTIEPCYQDSVLVTGPSSNFWLVHMMRE